MHTILFSRTNFKKIKTLFPKNANSRVLEKFSSYVQLVVVWPWYWPEGSHNGPRPKAEGHYGCPKDFKWIL